MAPLPTVSPATLDRVRGALWGETLSMCKRDADVRRPRDWLWASAAGARAVPRATSPTSFGHCSQPLPCRDVLPLAGIYIADALSMPVHW